jgi:phage baseplate assembly protein W
MATAPTLSTPLQTRQYSDFNIDFIPNPMTGDLTKVTGINSVVQSIVNLVSTNHYERPFHPEIGGNVRKLLFELVDGVTANLLSSEIKDVLANFEPRAQVLDVIVQTNNTQDGYSVTIVFQVAGGISTPITINTFLQRLR